MLHYSGGKLLSESIINSKLHIIEDCNHVLSLIWDSTCNSLYMELHGIKTIKPQVLVNFKSTPITGILQNDNAKSYLKGGHVKNLDI